MNKKLQLEHLIMYVNHIYIIKQFLKVK